MALKVIKSIADRRVSRENAAALVGFINTLKEGERVSAKDVEKRTGIAYWYVNPALRSLAEAGELVRESGMGKNNKKRTFLYQRTTVDEAPTEAPAPASAIPPEGHWTSDNRLVSNNQSPVAETTPSTTSPIPPAPETELTFAEYVLNKEQEIETVLHEAVRRVDSLLADILVESERHKKVDITSFSDDEIVAEALRRMKQ